MYRAVRDKGYDKGCSDIWIAWGMILGEISLICPFLTFWCTEKTSWFYGQLTHRKRRLKFPPRAIKLEGSCPRWAARCVLLTWLSSHPSTEAGFGFFVEINLVMWGTVAREWLGAVCASLGLLRARVHSLWGLKAMRTRQGRAGLPSAGACAVVVVVLPANSAQVRWRGWISDT